MGFVNHLPANLISYARCNNMHYMITNGKAARILAIISEAWGPADNTGYCFFPWIDRETGRFNEQAFQWPADRDKILTHLVEHEHHDLYWCPMIFEEPHRQVRHAHEEYALWADLDPVNPRNIDPKWEPSVAWSTSPGRYQALWLLKDPNNEDLEGASVRGADNQRLTYLIGADPSGWDTTQLLRLPTWTNHKPEYLVNGHSPTGKLLWSKGPRYTGADFNDLPELVVEDEPDFDMDILSELDDIDRKEVLLRIQPQLSPRILAKIRWTKAQIEASGKDRSLQAYVLMRFLADAGCSIAEIVAIIAPTPWNKFKGREEYLIREATKAADSVRDERKSQELTSTRFGDFARAQERPQWLIKDLMIGNSVGFIAGEPKARKSWIALDLAFSVAMNKQGYGTKFMDHFEVMNSGPVLYVALEDGGWLLQDRGNKMWQFKNRTPNQGIEIGDDGLPMWSEPPKLHRINVAMDVVSGVNLDLSDPEQRQEFLELVAGGYRNDRDEHEPYALVIIDTLMRAIGRTDINNLTEVMSILSPLSTYTQQPHVKTSILFVHHFNKSKVEGSPRGGTRMMGSQAIHAWSVDSLYVTSVDNRVTLESESKMAPTHQERFDLDPTHRTWSPTPVDEVKAPIRNLDFAGAEEPRRKPHGGGLRMSEGKLKVLAALRTLGAGAHRCSAIATEAGMASSNTHNILSQLELMGRVERSGKMWRIK